MYRKSGASGLRVMRLTSRCAAICKCVCVQKQALNGL